MRYHKDGTLPQDKECFVFGSNLAGRHGAGAAKAALAFGATYGTGEGYMWGPSGVCCYALPTKDKNIETLPLVCISAFVDEFRQFTLDHEEINFFVTAVGCGLAGYNHSDIAPMFRGSGRNCSFPEEWEKYLEFMSRNL